MLNSEASLFSLLILADLDQLKNSEVGTKRKKKKDLSPTAYDPTHS